MIDTIRRAWGWMGFDPAEIVATNAFGNVIVRATDGIYWRICPEEWFCEPIARREDEYAALSSDADFQTDWEMANLAEQARKNLGPLSDDRCYCLKQPAVIGGRYEAENLGTISRDELIAYSGHMAEQIKDVPDGEQIQIKWVP